MHLLQQIPDGTCHSGTSVIITMIMCYFSLIIIRPSHFPMMILLRTYIYIYKPAPSHSSDTLNQIQAMRRSCWWWLAAVAVAVAALQGGCEANLIKVGGRYGWSPNVNYTEWASTQHFYVGDWLCISPPLSLQLISLSLLNIYKTNKQTPSDLIHDTN